MHAHLEIIDSEAFGHNVLQIKNPEIISDFSNFEDEYKNKYHPFYVYVKIPVNSLPLIHFFESYQFNFVEYQLRMTKRLPRKKFDTSKFDDVMVMEEVEFNDNIEPILELSDKIFTTDRIFLDPQIGAKAAQDRYRAYITKSWRSEQEKLFRFYDRRNQKLIGFHTNTQTGPSDAMLLLGGIAEEYQASGMAFGSEYNIFNNFIDRGLCNLVTHISLANLRILNLEFKAMDFKSEQGFIILRKIYN